MSEMTAYDKRPKVHIKRRKNYRSPGSKLLHVQITIADDLHKYMDSKNCDSYTEGIASLLQFFKKSGAFEKELEFKQKELEFILTQNYPLGVFKLYHALYVITIDLKHIDDKAKQIAFLNKANIQLNNLYLELQGLIGMKEKIDKVLNPMLLGLKQEDEQVTTEGVENGQGNEKTNEA